MVEVLTSMPALVEWAKGQISLYADMFRKQVFSSDVDETTVKACIDTTHSLNKKVKMPFVPQATSYH